MASFEKSTGRPKFTRHLPNNIKAKEKESLTLNCELSKSTYAVTWFKNEKEVKNSSRIIISADGNTHSLSLKVMNKDDAGHYRCECKDDRDIASSCSVIVEERPKFTRHLPNDINAKEKEPVTLKCELSNYTNAVTWFKNEKEVKKSSRITISAHGNQHSLTINEMSKADGGQYRCECKDDRDIASHCSVIVEERPTFTRHLPNDIKAKEKESLTLNCEISKSTIAVIWFKNDKEVKNSSRITISADRNQYRLTIKDMNKDDAGEYRCECKDDRNIASSCSVIVEDTPSIWINSKSPIVVIVCSVLLNVIITYTGILDGTTRSEPYEVKGLDRLNAFSRRLDAIDTAVSDMEQQQENSKTALIKTLMKQREELLNKTIADLENISSKIENVERNISTKADEKDIHEAGERIEGKLVVIKGNFTTKVNDMESKFSTKLEEFNESTDVLNRTLSEYNTKFGQFANSTNIKIQEFSRLLQNLNLTVERDLISMLAQVKTQVKGIEDAKKKADELLGLLQGDVDRIIPNTFNKEALTMAFMVLIIFVFMLALWIYKVQNSLTAGGPGQHRDMNSKDVLQRIPHRVSLSNSICIISFDEARQEAHEALIKSAFLTAGNIQTKYFVVRRHEHLINLPRCKLFMMCTEFSERHVIIEELGLGLGDLKRCTYQMIQRYGAEMIILYTRDPGSRNLGDQLYNRKIHCVSAQPELSGLRDLGRFFSTYDELSETQKKALNETVVKCLQ